MKQKVKYPTGWLKGMEDPVPEVIKALAIEILAHRSDLLEMAQKTKFEVRADNLRAEADDLEKYAVALDSLYFQMCPEKWTPETCHGLIELAAKHKIFLPDWMTGKEKRKNWEPGKKFGSYDPTTE